MSYGIPYKGNKARIADALVSQMPSNEYFVDLFAGGCAVTEAAIKSGKFKKFIVNDIDWRPIELFKGKCNGKYKDENRWISREDFFKYKDSDEYVACCFSFGNDFKTYCYSRQIEPYKKALHYSLFYRDYSLMDKYGLDCRVLDKYDTPHKRRLHFKSDVLDNSDLLIKKGSHYYFKNNNMSQIDSLNNLEALVRIGGGGQIGRLENLERLQHLERLEKIQLGNLNNIDIIFYNKDYRNKKIIIPDNATIYCDIPYQNTNKYQDKFDYNDFYEWCIGQSNSVFISEYSMPSQFEEIWHKKVNTKMAAKTSGIYRIEKLFTIKR